MHLGGAHVDEAVQGRIKRQALHLYAYGEVSHRQHQGLRTIFVLDPAAAQGAARARNIGTHTPFATFISSNTRWHTGVRSTCAASNAACNKDTVVACHPVRTRHSRHLITQQHHMHLCSMYFTPHAPPQSTTLHHAALHTVVPDITLSTPGHHIEPSCTAWTVNCNHCAIPPIPQVQDGPGSTRNDRFARCMVRSLGRANT